MANLLSRARTPRPHGPFYPRIAQISAPYKLALAVSKDFDACRRWLKDSFHDESSENRALALLRGQTASEDIASRLTLKCIRARSAAFESMTLCFIGG
jgi:hypothetical protein